VTREQAIAKAASAVDDATSAVLTDHIVQQAAEEALEAVGFHAISEALESIRAFEDAPFDGFPADWHEQIKRCAECQRFKDHPIQGGICDEHRRPLHERDRWEARLPARFMGHVRDVLAGLRK
jgi:hypothetical protein